MAPTRPRRGGSAVVSSPPPDETKKERTEDEDEDESTPASPANVVDIREEEIPSFKNPNRVKAKAGKKRTWKNLKQMLAQDALSTLPVDYPTYKNIEAPPSLYPKKKYCDITGKLAPYTDPKTGLRYCNAQVYRKIASMPDEKVQRYLALRKAHVVIK